MERDVKTMFRQKIKAADQNPVSWNKAGVWKQIQPQIKQQKKYTTFYYYAAAALTGILIFTLFQPNDLSKSLSGLENRIEIQEKYLSVEKGKIPEAQETDCGSLIFAKGKNSATKKIKRSRAEPKLMANDEIISIAENEIPLSVVEEMDSSVVQPPRDIAVINAPSRIEPIIGIYDTIDKKIEVRKKKTKLHRLGTPDGKQLDEISRNSILARIK